MILFKEHEKRILSEAQVCCDGAEKQRTFSKVKPKEGDLPCYELIYRPATEDYHLKTHYYIGIDWLNQKAGTTLRVRPKLTVATDELEVDFLQMYLDCLTDTRVRPVIKDLYDIHWDEPWLTVEQQESFFTPFLLVEYLRTLEQIVRKGLKRSYQRTRRVLRGRIKGKLHIAATVGQQLRTVNQLDNVCSFDQFTVDTPENRLLKKALQFTQRYLPELLNAKKPTEQQFLTQTLGYIRPAFQSVGTDISVRELRNYRPNAFFTEYDRGLRLAKVILQRFGYNLNLSATQPVQIPPFWIDMSRLFELWVLHKLRERFPSDGELQYQFPAHYQELDYLLKTADYRMVIDAKYKTVYQGDGSDKENMRQVSGYSRLRKVRNWLDVDDRQLVDCLIIYPDQTSGHEDFIQPLSILPIAPYVGMYKYPIRLPVR